VHVRGVGARHNDGVDGVDVLVHEWFMNGS
jgi:hypothetical protein